MQEEEKQYETVIGLEVHVELSTKTKIFCGCSTRFGAPPNTQTCPVCTGMPGTLPVLNRQVVEYALALGLALHCEVNRYCRFDRKNYFYPDNPQNYQISQLYLPVCYNGEIEIALAGEREEKENSALPEAAGTGRKKKIRIHELHMEEDAGKLVHEENGDSSLVDYNRSGVPLIEIVSEPDMRNAEEAVAYLEKLCMLCRYLGISDGKLQEGSLRADVNLSVRKAGCRTLGTRTEMKNLNSFRAVSRAVAEERRRQIALLEEGKKVIQETRRWDDAKGVSYPIRSKEDAEDYRYFPEPDVPPVVISEKWTEEIRGRLPEFREEKEARYQKEFGLSAYDAGVLTQSKHLAELFEETAVLCGKPKKAANWFMGELLRLLKEKGMEPEELMFSPKHLADLIAAAEQGKINQANAQKVFAEIVERDVEPLSYMKEQRLESLSDEGMLRLAAEEVLAGNPGLVAEFHAGKEKVFGFFVGQIMKKTKGMADPGKVNALLRQLLMPGE